MEFPNLGGGGRSDGICLIVFETLGVVLQACSVIFNGAIVSTLWKNSLFKCPSNK
jgi:hypothetical protein